MEIAQRLPVVLANLSNLPGRPRVPTWKRGGEQRSVIEIRAENPSGTTRWNPEEISALRSISRRCYPPRPRGCETKVHRNEHVVDVSSCFIPTHRRISAEGQSNWIRLVPQGQIYMFHQLFFSNFFGKTYGLCMLWLIPRKRLHVLSILAHTYT